MATGLTLFPIKEISSTYGNSGVIVCALLLFFSYLTVSLRLYTRVFIIHNTGWDDIFVLLSLVGYSNGKQLCKLALIYIQISLTFFCVLLSLLCEIVPNRNVLTEHQLTIITNVRVLMMAVP
jgi:hypothetical protein